jgi:protein-L-isoaspartate(D-aspartate) O-methyltransferase
MTDLVVGATPRNRVLEIGSGSGYQSAILSKFFKEVYTMEIIPELVIRAGKALERLGYSNIYIKQGNGEWGWIEKSPFDAIIVTAGLEKKIPKKLFDQLKVDGILVAPIGIGVNKTMVRLTKVKGVKFNDLIKPDLLKLRGLWEEFGTFHFVPFVKLR